MDCKHEIIINDKCIKCGKIIYDVENRYCFKCKNFKKVNPDLSICKKKLMLLTNDMKVTYEIEKGSCYE